MRSIGWRLEQYTIKRPQEVLLVTIELPGQESDGAIPKPSQPESSQPDPSQLESSQLESSQPESSQLESSQPESSQPESSHLESDRLDQIAIFKGFSSSLIRPTAFDPDIPMIPEQAVIVAIDRLASPFHPDRPHYLQRGLSLADMEVLLSEVGI